MPQLAADSIVFEPASVSVSAVAARYARMTPGKLHVAFPLLVMAVLYWLSSLPVTPLHEDPALYGLFYRIPSWLQNALHVPAYAILAWTTWWALGAWLREASTKVISACAIASAYGFFDEWHQFFVPGRYASFIDVILDLAGVAVGIWLAAWTGSRARTIMSRTKRDKVYPKI